jgi:hypothetical protein
MLPPYELFLSAPTSTDAHESTSSWPIWVPVLLGVVATWATALTLTFG